MQVVMVTFALRPRVVTASAWIKSSSRRYSNVLPRVDDTSKLFPRQHPRLRSRQSCLLQQLRTATLTNTSSSSFSLSSSDDSVVSDQKDVSTYKLQLLIPTAEDMEDVGALLSQQSGPGDVILLDGDLGAGKTGLSRGFVRARTGNLEQRVTSPTFLLSNAYPTHDGLEIRHMDLYRLSGEEEDLRPLDLDFVFQNCIALIEWPSRLGPKRPLQWLEVDIRIAPCNDEDTSATDTGDVADDVSDFLRCVDLTPRGKYWEERLRALVDDGVLDDLIVANESDSVNL